MRTPALAAALLVPVLATFTAPLAAQYKWVGPTGAITYSDLPPPPGMSGNAMGLPTPGRADDQAVPPALRTAATKFPVMLYTTNACAPCQHARAHLSARGIPYSERTVTSTADAEVFRKAGFAENSFPAVSVGRERSIGFEGAEWDRLLDAAGYPKQSALPPSYKQAPARSASAIEAARGAVASNDAGGIVPAAADGTEAPPAVVPARQRGPAPRADGERPASPPQRDRTTVRF